MNKPKITTIILLAMTLFLMVAVLVIGYIITRPSETVSLVAPRKTRAQSVTYRKLITLNTSARGGISPTVAPTANLSPTAGLSPTTALTPTEIILARSNTPTPTVSPTKTASASGTVTPTKTSSLPATGTITNALFIFAAAALMIFFSFLF